MFADDAAAAFDVVLRRGSVGSVYNIGTPFVRRNIEVAEDLLLAFGYGDAGAGAGAGAGDGGRGADAAAAGAGASAKRPRLADLHRYVDYVADRPFNDLRYPLETSKLKKVRGRRAQVAWLSCFLVGSTA